MDKKSILVVDDEKDLVETVTFRLESAGYKIIPAYDGLEALEKARMEKRQRIIEVALGHEDTPFGW